MFEDNLVTNLYIQSLFEKLKGMGINEIDADALNIIKKFFDNVRVHNPTLPKGILKSTDKSFNKKPKAKRFLIFLS